MSYEPKVVDITEKQSVVYCIPDWLREEQIKMSCVNKKYGRISPAKEIRAEPIALVCFGPSLNDTWLGIKEFKFKMSCSGGHKFLRDRGITPDWHVEVDPRAHKTQLIGNSISPDTEFLMASCCHPDVFAHLEKFNANISLWHTYSGENKDKIPLIFPRGEWVVTGGANVGLRALVLARLLGFTNIHVFGMDGSFNRPDGEGQGLRHADFHPNVAKKYIITKVEDKKYYTTPAFLECAKQTFHELAMLPDTSITFYGNGLIQHMAKIDKTERRNKVQIAFCSLPTISEEYVKQNKELHEINATYGISVLKHLDTIKKLYESTKSKSLLDYGCGKGMLAKNLDFPIWEYDPAIPGKDNPPRAADFVTCIDVLEHVEPELLDRVLKDLSRCVKSVGYFVIGTTAAVKTLPDGRNTHLIQEGKDWWKERIDKYFTIPEKGVFEKGHDIYFIVGPKNNKGCENKDFIVTTKGELCLSPSTLTV